LALFSGGPPFGPLLWDLHDSANDYIKNYDPTKEKPHEQFVDLTTADLGRRTLNFYGVVDRQNHEFSVTAGGLAAATKFSIKKPGRSIWSGPDPRPLHPNLFAVTGVYNVPEASGTTLRGHAEWGTGLPAEYVGQVSFVQLLNSWQYTSPGEHVTRYTRGSWQLDEEYPYHTAWPVGNRFEMDDPEVSQPIATILALKMYFHGWLMWTPPGGIPVPIQDWQWQAVNTAVWNRAAKVWDHLHAPSAATPITGANTESYPTWSQVLTA
jgi:hypothetical protein